MKDNKLVEVCSECKMAACWEGIFMCEKNEHAGTKLMTVGELRILNKESAHYWSDEHMKKVYGESNPFGFKEASDININTFAKEVHQNAVDHGWWEEQRSFGEIIALCHSELSEALEEHRNGRGQREIYYNDSEPDKPEGISIELADVIIRVLDYCGREQIDIDYAVKLKHKYNKSRPYRHGGKKL